MISGVSTLGVTFGYAPETTAGEKPTAFAELGRINKLGGISLDVEQIDSSALKDKITRYIAGRADTGGTWSVTINLTDETMTEWDTVSSTYAALTGGKRMWFQVTIPGITKSFFVVAQPHASMPFPDMDQNSLLVADMDLIIEEYIGPDTTVAMTGGEE